MIQILRNRPLLLLLLTLIIGLSLREYPFNALFLLLGIPIVRTRTHFMAGSLGLLAGIWFSPSLPDSSIQSTSFYAGPAVVASVPRIQNDGESVELDLSGGRVTAFFPGRSDLSPGDRFRVEGLIRPLSEGSESYARLHGIVARFKPVSVNELQPGPSWIRRCLEVRRSFVAFTHRNLAENSADMIDALCFNVTGGLNQGTMQKLVDTGTVHIVSASGLHVLVIAASLHWVLGFFPIPRSLRILFVLALLLFYAAAAGLQPAILRSVAMGAVMMSAYLFRREPDLLSALSLAGVGYLLFVPIGIYDMGFQLSFVTVAAFALTPVFHSDEASTARHLARTALVESLRSTAVAFIATLPLTLFYFDVVAITAIPSNLLIGMAVMVEVVVSLTAYLLAAIPVFSSLLMNGLAGPLADYIRVVLESVPVATLSGGYFSGYWIVFLFGVALLFVRERVRPA